MKIRMARTSDGLTGATYFHGSAHEFEVGAVLTPESGDQDGEYVYLADSARVAALYAQLAASRMHGVPIPNDLGGVYEVEPLGSVEDDPVQEWGGEHRTSGNVRVLRKVDPASTHTAGPAGNMVPFERFPILTPQRFGPRDVKVLRMAEQDIKRLHPGQQAKVREAIEALKAGTAQVEAKERHPLVGSYTVRVTNSLRLGLYLTEDQPGGDPAPDWVVYIVTDHRYDEAERRMQMNPGARTAAGSSYSGRKGVKVGTYKEFDLHHQSGVGTFEHIWAYLTNDLRGPGWELVDVGNLRWWNAQGPQYGMEPGVIDWVNVNDPHRRKGLASAMLETARKIDPKVRHSTRLTDDGRAWSERVAAFDYDHARKTYDQVRSIAKKYTLWDFEGEARDLLRRVLTEAGFPRGEHAEVKVLVGRPDLHGVVAWDLNEGLGTNPLVMMSMKSANEFVLLHEAAHILRNGPSAIGRVGADVDDAHDQRWWDTFTRLIGMYATPLLANAFRHLVLKDVDPSLLRAAARGMTWDQVKSRYPVYAGFGMDHAVNELAHIPDGEMVTPDLTYTEETVDLRDVRFQRYPISDSRMARALEGYETGMPIAPVLLVRRAGELHTVDGHHRLSAQEALGRTQVSAVIAHSLRTDRYAGSVSIGHTSRTASVVPFDGETMVWNVVVMPPGVRHDIGGTVYVDKPGLGGDFQFRFPYREDAVGLLRWYPDGEISDVWVHPDYRRQGLATEMLRRAREAEPYVDIHHSEALTSDGQEWSRRVAAFGDGAHVGATPGPLTSVDTQAGAMAVSLEDNPYPSGTTGLAGHIDGVRVCELFWWVLPEGTVSDGMTSEGEGVIWRVWTRSGYRRQGLASSLLRIAREIEPRVRHSTDLTDEGRAWSERVGSTPSAPVQPGTAPIPPGTTRLYHVTSAANLAAIQREGLLVSRSVADMGAGSATWASKELDYWRGNDPDAVMIEFYATPDQMDSRLEWSATAAHVGLTEDIPPSQFVALHEPWHTYYRSLQSRRQRVLDGEFDHALGDETSRKAIEQIKREGARHTAADLMLHQDVFYRTHDRMRAFSVEDATSSPLNLSFDDHLDAPREGYSACYTPWDLWAYVVIQGWTKLTFDDDVLIFSGEAVGDGVDNEPLVVPDHRIERFISWRDFLWALSRITSRIPRSIQGPLASIDIIRLATLALEADPNDPVAQRIMADMFPQEAWEMALPQYGMFPFAASLHTASQPAHLLEAEWDVIMDQPRAQVRDLQDLARRILTERGYGWAADEVEVHGDAGLMAGGQTGVNPLKRDHLIPEILLSPMALNTVGLLHEVAHVLAVGYPWTPGSDPTGGHDGSWRSIYASLLQEYGPGSAEPLRAALGSKTAASVAETSYRVVTYEEEPWIQDDRTMVVAEVGGDRVGHIIWDSRHGGPMIDDIEVIDAYRRQGIATEMLRRAREIEPELAHSTLLTGDGRAWSQTVASAPERPARMVQTYPPVHGGKFHARRDPIAEVARCRSTIMLDVTAMPTMADPTGKTHPIVCPRCMAAVAKDWQRTSSLSLDSGDYTPGARQTKWKARASDGRTAGYVLFHEEWDDDLGNVAVIDMIETNPAYARQGVASFLYRELLDTYDGVKHTGEFTPEGAAWWAKMTGESVSPNSRSSQDRGRDWTYASLTTTAYQGGHRAPSGADDVAAPLHDVEEMMPDYYEHPEWYPHDRGPVDAETSRVIRGAKGQPDKMITIYRALPPGFTTINDGDWVTISRTYALGHAMQSDDPSEDWPVITAEVPARTLWTEGYAAEWGYDGSPVSARLARAHVGSPSLLRSAVADSQGFWYHYGTSMIRYEEGQYVHVGTREAAESRHRGMHGEGNFRHDGTLMRAKISPRNPLGSESAPLNDHDVNILTDWESWGASARGEMPSEENGGDQRPWQYNGVTKETPMSIAARVGYRGAWVHDAFFYRNEVEDKGSISVAIDPSCITEEGEAPPTNPDVGEGQLLLWGARHRRLAATTYFHGTSMSLPVGTQITPREPGAWEPGQPTRSPMERWNDPAVAYATSSETSAWWWAEHSWNAGRGDVPRVYIVEPLGEVHPDPNGENAGDVVSTDGWRVVGESTGGDYDFWHEGALKSTGSGYERTAVSSWKRTPGGQSYRTSIVGKNGTTYYITGSFESFSAFAENFSERLREYVKVPVGRMHLWNLPGHWEIHQVQVNADHRRQGVASAMLDLAREFHPDVVHSGPGALTDDGAAWAGAYASLRTESAEREIVVSAEGHLWTWRCSVCGEGPPNRGYRDKSYAHEMGYTHAQWCWDLGWDDTPRVVTASGLIFEHLRGVNTQDGELVPVDYPNTDALVAREGGKDVGFILWYAGGGLSGSVDMVWVDESHRRKGLATELLRRSREIQPDIDPTRTPWFSDEGKAWVNSLPGVYVSSTTSRLGNGDSEAVG